MDRGHAEGLTGRSRRAAARRRPALTLLRLLPRASRPATALLGFEVLATGLLPVVVTLAIGTIVAAAAGEEGSTLPGVHSPWVALGVIAAAFTVLQVALPFVEPARESLAHRLDLFVRHRIMAALLRPAGLAHLEDPRLADRIRMARGIGTDAPDTSRTLQALTAIGSARLLAVASGAVLFVYRWWAPLALAAAWFVSHGWHRREMDTLVASFEQSTDGFRRAQYIRDLAMQGRAAKEVRLFGLADWLVTRFRHHWEAALRDVWAQRRRHRARGAGAMAVVALAHLGVLAALARSTVDGEIGVGELAVYAQAVVAMVGLSWDADNEYFLVLGAAPLSHLLSLDEAAGRAGFPLEGRGTPAGRPQVGVHCQGVRFAYPGTAEPVLDGVDLWIAAGRSLAIVGENGCGKTTLLKLLCRFYDPTNGTIGIDGVDLRHFDPSRWQRSVAAVFQDFGRYPLRARDNVGFGDLVRRHDDNALDQATAWAGAAGVVDRLPGGWDTPLSRQLRGGIELSGGQWQRIALARALMAVRAGARLLILDEPTASLDIRAEAEFYDRFLELTRGLTTIVVSHRFSTVRHADHIVVMDRGRVVEQGSHDQLLARRGRYAAMFDLQASMFRETADA